MGIVVPAVSAAAARLLRFWTVEVGVSVGKVGVAGDRVEVLTVEEPKTITPTSVLGEDEVGAGTEDALSVVAVEAGAGVAAAVGAGLGVAGGGVEPEGITAVWAGLFCTGGPLLPPWLVVGAGAGLGVGAVLTVNERTM